MHMHVINMVKFVWLRLGPSKLVNSKVQGLQLQDQFHNHHEPTNFHQWMHRKTNRLMRFSMPFCHPGIVYLCLASYIHVCYSLTLEVLYISSLWSPRPSESDFVLSWTLFQFGLSWTFSFFQSLVASTCLSWLLICFTVLHWMPTMGPSICYPHSPPPPTPPQRCQHPLKKKLKGTYFGST